MIAQSPSLAGVISMRVRAASGRSRWEGSVRAMERWPADAVLAGWCAVRRDGDGCSLTEMLLLRRRQRRSTDVTGQV